MNLILPLLFILFIATILITQLEDEYFLRMEENYNLLKTSCFYPIHSFTRRKTERRVGIRLILFILLFFSLFTKHAYSQEFSDWKIQVKLEENGDAQVKNIWTTHETKGTEKFLPITNLGDSEILDFQVQENGILFDSVENWNSDLDREEKIGKSGILKTNQGLELVFGLGEYGDHQYEFQYRVTNMVKSLEDGQSLYWRFVNDRMDPSPENIEIILQSFEPFTEETVKMWSFGYPGDIRLDKETGSIIARSNGPLDSRHFATLLLQFPENYFSTDSTLNKTQEELRAQAMEGSDYLDENSEESLMDKIFFYLGLGAIGLTIIGVPFIIRAVYRSSKSSAWMRQLKKQYRSREKLLKDSYYRDLPYHGNPSDLTHLMDYISFFDVENIISVYLLKWIKSGAIEILETEEGSILKRKEAAIKFNFRPSMNSPSEVEFFDLLVKARGSKEILEEEDLKKFFKKNYDLYTQFLIHLEGFSIKALKEKGFLEERVDGQPYQHTMDVITEKGKKLFDNVIMFRNYLHDFSLLPERSVYDIHLWEDYLIYAAFYGMTEEVYKQFNALEPTFQRDSSFYPHHIYMSHMAASQIQSSYNSARSSGSGGSSSIGGGGGSFGGGSGGGTR